MFSGGAIKRTAGVGIDVLEALALAGRIERQHGKSAACQILKNGLIASIGFAFGGVAKWSKNRRERRVTGFGQIQMRRDIKSGLTLEDYLLDPIRVALNRPGHLRIQRRSFELASDQLPDFGPNHRSTFGRLARRFNTRKLCLATRSCSSDLPDHVIGEIVPVVLLVRNLQSVGRPFTLCSARGESCRQSQRAHFEEIAPGLHRSRAQVYHGPAPMRRYSTLVFITAIMCCVLPAVARAAAVEVKQAANRIDITIDGKPFTTYYFDSDVAKAYLMPLQTAAGLVISRPFPAGNDVSKGNPKDSSFEPHQRPLYFAHGNIDGLDFWGEAAFVKYYTDHFRQAYGHMAGAKIELAQGGSDSGKIAASFALEDPNNRVVGHETQSFDFRGDDRTRTIDCDFVLKASDGPLTLGDTKEGTFGIRLGPDLSAPRGHMINSQGGKGEKEIWGKRADWVNYYGEVSGKPAGIVVFDHPKSFRHPATWHARGYGLLAVNPFAFREFTNDPNQDGSWTIPEGKTLEFRYRVLIYDGEMSAAQIAEAYQRYAAEP